jgi:methylmalonyl-CoA/ethylmalonyl-CoA epimerase
MRAEETASLLRITADGLGCDGVDVTAAERDPAGLAATADLMTGLRGVDHVAVLVPDIDAALGEFGGRLGLSVASDETLEDAAVRLVHLDAGNVDLQLVEPQGPGRLADDLKRHGPGLHHVCFGVPALPGALAGLGEPAQGTFRGGQGRPACFLASRPGGLYIELIEFAGGPAFGTFSTAMHRLMGYWADECSRDLPAVLAHFAADAEVLTPDGRYAGHDAIAGMYAGSFAAYPRLEVTVTGRFAGRDAHAFEYSAVLTDTAGLPWLVEGVNLITVRDGLIARLRSYEDAPKRRSRS